ncbi:MAG TPA: thermopsin, partial [Thermoplasmata archaeon]|nr:thermopsin [Thermoplasmata archaeon]
LRAQPPIHRPGTPPSATVNPELLYAAEPAPMGIDDFGVDSSGNGYRYTTSEFLGIAEIRTLQVDNPSLGGDEYMLTIQQNVCLEFTVGGTEYQFWIQNVVFLDTSANQTSFENNIWNLSAGGGGMDSNSVTGNGSVYASEFYLDAADTPGSSITLTYPTPIEFLVVQSVVNGEPAVAFEYRDGAKWETYDNVVFPFGRGATGVNFVVDGTQYAPDGLFDDAELILGGPGGGSSTSATKLNLSLSESFFNGQNFQAIRNAYNFGSDTAEAIDNVAAAKATVTGNASLAVRLNTGSATLGLVYGNAYSALVTVKSPVSAGTLIIDSTPAIPFTTSSFNITIAPGAYTFYVDNATGAIGSQAATISAGSNSTVTVALGTTYAVTFGETGLASAQLNASWNVTLGGLTLASTSTFVRFFMVNGSFAYTTPPIPGYLLNDSTGSAVVAGSDDLILFPFVQVVYAVTLYETGLPLGTAWSIYVNGANYSSTSVSLHFALPNGTFTYTLGIVPGWTAAPSAHATLHIAAGPISRTLNFRQFTYAVLAVESGLPSGALWGIDIDSNLTVGTFFALRTYDPNGSYSYRISPPAGWFATPSQGSFEIAAGDVTLNFTFQPFAYFVNFTARGLAAGTRWGIVLHGVAFDSTNATIAAVLANGSYPYTVDAVAGYEPAVPSGGTAVVAGADQSIDLQFTLLPVIDGYLLGSIQPAGATLLVDGVPVTLSGNTFNVSLPPGVHAIEVTLAGYHPYFNNFTISAGARTNVPTIVLSQLPTGPGGTTTPGTGGGGSSAPAGPLVAGLLAVLAGAVIVLGLILWLRQRPR